MSLKKLAILPFLLLLPGLAASADLAREQRIAEQIVDAIFDGETLYLPDGEHEFLAIYTEATTDETIGAALVLHGRGANPDWVDVVQPLRVGLTEAGWDTLSIQLPVAREGASDAEWLALVEEAAPRIDAALAMLREKQIRNVVIVAHSFGSRMAADYLAKNSPAEVQAFVAIGMSGEDADPNSGTLGALRKISLPTYDLYGQRDLPQVLDTVNQRARAARDAGNENYRQNEVAGADHFFAGQDALLLSTVRAWLHKHAKGSQVE